MILTLPQAIGSYGAGLMDIEELHKIECHAIPGSGACGKYYLVFQIELRNMKYCIIM